MVPWQAWLLVGLCHRRRNSVWKSTVPVETNERSSPPAVSIAYTTKNNGYNGKEAER